MIADRYVELPLGFTALVSWIGYREWRESVCDGDLSGGWACVSAERFVNGRHRGVYVRVLGLEVSVF